jgi:glutamate racemase
MTLKRAWLALLWAAMSYCLLPAQDVLPALRDTGSYYYVDFENYPLGNKDLPVGVFDSGTGGLTVLDAIVRFDRYKNYTDIPEPDKLPDFTTEQFVYLADQANMPYGNYAGTGKTDL